MSENYCLILAAGKGTRMGPIGELVPKVFWPIFELSILEIQIRTALTFNFKRIFINSYFYSDYFKRFFKNKKLDNRVEIVYEKDEIDIGGAIHNIANKVSYEGKLAVFNSDQLLIGLDVNSFLRNLKKSGALFLIDTNKSEGYNKVVVDKNGYYHHVENKNIVDEDKYQTYTGNCILDLCKLEKFEGYSRFFESVVFKENEFECISIDSKSYWDFGTLEKYKISMFNALRDRDFLNFLRKQLAFDDRKFEPDSCSYGVTEAKNKILLGSSTKVSLKRHDEVKQIYLNGRVSAKAEAGVFYNFNGQFIY